MAKKVVNASLVMFTLTVLLWGNAYAFPTVGQDVFEDDEGGEVTGNVLDNDDAVPAGFLTIVGSSLPAGMTLDDNSLSGDFGEVTYIHPDEHFSGIVTFTYDVRQVDLADCDIATPDPLCTVTGNGITYFAPEADLPIVSAPGSTGSEDTAIPLGLTITPVDTSETLEIILGGVPTGAVLSGGTQLTADSYALSLAEANSLTLTPPLNFGGAIGLNLSVETTDSVLDPDGDLDEDQDSMGTGFVLFVNDVDDDPTATGLIPTLDTVEDTPASVDLAAAVTDVDFGDSFNFVIDSIDNTAIDTATMVGSILDITLLPDAFANGTVTVEVFDADGGVPVVLVIPVNVAEENDAPTVVGAVPPVDVLEDAPAEVIDFSSVFNDVDVATGDSLSLAAVFVSGDTVVDSISSSGLELTLNFALHANGAAVYRIDATDAGGEVAQYLLNVDVQAVNDEPTTPGVISDRNINEDDPPEMVSVAGVFSDVDVATNGDVLSYTASATTNPGIFSSLIFVDDVLTITLTPDANGVALISVIATDSGGLTSSVPATFEITVNGVDDLPIAANDVAAAIDEDTTAVIRIPVMANDYLGDQPATLRSVFNMGTYLVADVEGNLVPYEQGTLIIDGDEVIYVPRPNFWGTATFEYEIEDSNGDISSAQVSIDVTPINDAPEGLQTHRYSVFEGATLTVELANGLLVGAYDIDPAAVDSNGDPLAPEPLSIIFETAPPPAEGTLSTTASDGTFTFMPTPGFTGETSFEYSVFDNQVRSALGDVVIEVLPLPPVADTPNPGEVSVFYNLANTPLEQSATVSPNVLVTMDDSGSMDWQVSADSTDDNGRFVINNNGIATSSRRERVYSYLFSLNVNSYSATSGNGRVVPSEESLPAGNDYQVWRARNSTFNGIYYNPLVDYRPWTGLDNANVDLADAVPNAIRLDPISASNTFDITTPVNYLASSVPRWQTNGGSANINVTNFYIPRYYTDAGVRVEIRDDGSMYPGGPQRDDCAATDDTCTYDEEIQNFANWFQYYRSRELVAKAAVGNVVAELQDIRVGYETINRREDEAIADMNEFYWEGEKKELLDTIYEVNSSGGTPLRRALDDAGRLLACDRGDRDCPALPIPEGICQQNFTLLFSDGYWNGSTPRPGNFDGDDSSVFDGGKYEDTHSNTLADIAMYYYENDMFPAVDDGVPLATADVDGVPVGTYASSNDFIHQHMKTFTIAFGVEPDIDPLTAETALANDTFAWPAPGSAANAKIDDMLHAAINGRGRFLNAGNPGELQAAVGTAFREFTQAASSSSAAAFNSTSLREGTFLFRGFYDLRNRTGEMTASTVNEATGEIATVPSWTAATYAGSHWAAQLDAGPAYYFQLRPR